MANIFELNINLNSTEETETEKALKKTSNAKVAETDPGDDKSDGALKIAGKAAAAVLGIQRVKSDVVMPFYNMGITTVGTIYGDAARMNQIQNLTNTVNMGIGMVQTGLSGYSIGFASGGSSKGAGSVGAIIAIALDLVGKTIDGVTNAMEYNNKQQDHKYNEAYGKERLGLLAINKGR